MSAVFAKPSFIRPRLDRTAVWICRWMTDATVRSRREPPNRRRLLLLIRHGWVQELQAFRLWRWAAVGGSLESDFGLLAFEPAGPCGDGIFP